MADPNAFDATYNGLKAEWEAAKAYEGDARAVFEAGLGSYGQDLCGDICGDAGRWLGRNLGKAINAVFGGENVCYDNPRQCIATNELANVFYWMAPAIFEDWEKRVQELMEVLPMRQGPGTWQTQDYQRAVELMAVAPDIDTMGPRWPWPSSADYSTTAANWDSFARHVADTYADFQLQLAAAQLAAMQYAEPAKLVEQNEEANRRPVLSEPEPPEKKASSSAAPIIIGGVVVLGLGLALAR